jgi:peptide/nickel transport system permease protein
MIMRNALARHRWWIQRVALFPVHLALFSVITFVLIRSIPGDPVMRFLTDDFTAEEYAAVQARLGLDGSLVDQFVAYFSGLLRLDLGNSMVTGRDISGEILARLPATVELTVTSMGLALALALVGALVMLARRNNPLSVALRVYARTAGAIPEYVLAIVGIVVFYSLLRWAPAPIGRLDPLISSAPDITGFPLLDTVLSGRWDATASMLSHLVIPIAVMVLSQAAVILKMLISGLEHARNEPSTRFRVASGAPTAMVLASMLRRALPPVVTLCGAVFGALLGGAVIIESLFGFSGIGSYAIDAVNSLDYPVIQAFLLTIATLTLLVFLAVDIINQLLDPRRRPGARSVGEA